MNDQAAMNDETLVKDETAVDETSVDEATADRAEPTDSEPTTQAPVATQADGQGDGLLPTDQNDKFKSRWQEIQASFVDKPQDAVQEADALVVDLMQRVTGGLTSEREKLESQWAQGDDVSTEDLRVALTRYRTFFDRLLSA